MIWKIKATWRLKTVYGFNWADARELAYILADANEGGYYSAKEMVDEEMTYWGD